MTEIIAARVRDLRLKANLTQKTLSVNSGVALATLKHFERTGQISLKHLIMLATALDRQDDLLGIFKEKLPASLDELKRKRARGVL
ncbi:MAG: helix-turn-helix transcriptional regulator [Verrucomicrobiales bacterium]|nr:helix-turn-helix transcriptional regulator [Verrucomicrobiales bacterium]